MCLFNGRLARSHRVRVEVLAENVSRMLEEAAMGASGQGEKYLSMKFEIYYTQQPIYLIMLSCLEYY